MAEGKGALSAQLAQIDHAEEEEEVEEAADPIKKGKGKKGLPKVLPKTFIAPQCLQWQRILADLYKTVKQKAALYQFYAGSTSMLIIVLNVLIVGKGDLKLSDVTVALFVVFMTILKSLQVQFQFSPVSSQLSASLGAIRDTIVAVEDQRSLGSHGPKDSEDSFVTSVEYEIVKAKVGAAVQEVPSWVLLSIGKAKSKTVDALKADGEAGSGEGGVDSEAKAPADKKIEQSMSHCAAPPIDECEIAFDVEAQGPIRLLQVDGVHTMQAAAPIDPAGVQANCEDSIALAVAQAQEAKNAAMVQVQLKILNGMTATLNPAAKAAAKFDKVFHTIATTQTAIELAINAMIMAISSIPDGSFIDLSNEKNAVLALLAAVNGVIKGIDMKMQFEVLRANAAETDKAIKTLKSKVENKVVELDALQTPLEEAAFAAYKNEFQALVTKYANWLGNNA